MPKELQNYFTSPDMWARQIEEATPVLLVSELTLKHLSPFLSPRLILAQYMNDTLQRYISQQAGELRNKEVRLACVLELLLNLVCAEHHSWRQREGQSVRKDGEKDGGLGEAESDTRAVRTCSSRWSSVDWLQRER